MRSYTCTVKREDGFVESVDIDADSANEAAQKAVAYCNVHPSKETLWEVKIIGARGIVLPAVQIRTRLRMHYEIEA